MELTDLFPRHDPSIQWALTAMIGERFEGLDEGLVSQDRRAILEKIAIEPKIRKWFQDLDTRLVPKSRFDP
jgi:hypothetical protein